MEEVTALANVDVNDFAEFAGMGLDSIKSSDLVVPRLSILQAMSPVVTAEDSDVKAGNIYNLTTGDNFGKSIEFILLNYWLSRTKWTSPDPGSPIECIAPDGITGTVHGLCAACPFAQWQGTEPPACTDFMNLIMLIKPLSGDFSDASWANYAAKRAAITPTKRLLTAIKTFSMGGVQMPIFAGIYQMSLVRKENQGVFYVPEFKRTGVVSKALLPSVAAKWKEFEMIRQEAVKVAAMQNSADDDSNEEKPDEQAKDY